MLTNPEFGVIGSILMAPECLAEVRTAVSAGDFASADARAVFQTACALADRGEPVDPVVVLAASGVPEAWLASVVDLTPTAAHAMQYAQEVHRTAQLRALQALGDDLSGQAVEPGADPVALIGAAQDRLEAISEGQATQLVDSLTAAANFVEFRQRLASGETAAIPCGFQSLEGILGGFLRGGLYIIAARPGVGKTALGLILADMAAQVRRVLFVSLEMSETELTARRVANISGVGSGAVLHKADLKPEQSEAIGSALSEISQRKLTMNRCPSATVAEIGIMARSCKAELLVLDYLGLIQPEKAGLSRYESTTLISNGLKRLARSLGVPVLCLAQLNRQSEARSDKRPMLADLRDSGAIEQDADGVLLLHRPALFWPETEQPKPWEGQPFEIHVAKNRHGPVGTAVLQWYSNNGRFTDRGGNSWQ